VAVNWAMMSNWDRVLPPSRPDIDELDRIVSHIRLYQPVRAAVLGSTPEFCDLLVRLGVETTVLDRNFEFHTRSLRWRAWPGYVDLVLGDWLDSLPTLSGKFDLLLSDLTSGNIPYDDRERFYEAVGSALAPGGHFFDKVLTNEAPLTTLAYIEQKYSRLPLNLRTTNDFSCEAVFCSEIQLAAEVVDTTQTYARLMRDIPTRSMEAFVREAQRITPSGNLWYYGRDWPALEKGYCRSLKLIEKNRVNVGGPYDGRAFQYLWKKGTK